MPRQTTLRNTPVRSSVYEYLPYISEVSIDEEAIEQKAKDLAKEEFELPSWRAPVFPDENDQDISNEDVLDFLFVGNSINFQFRHHDNGDKFVAEYDDIEWEGAFGMWACLRRALEEDERYIRGEYLSNLSESQAHQLFEPSDGKEIPMLSSRVDILNSVGQELVENYQGRFSNFVDDCDPRLFADGGGLVERLVTEFPSFDDTSEVVVEGETKAVHFYKRAQLAPGMAYGRFSGTEFFKIQDPESFTVFADYNLPNVLRGFNLLHYSESLSEQIESGTPLEVDSPEEVALRAATIYTADRLIEEINRHRTNPINGAHMDYKLFEKRDVADHPVHKTVTTSY